MLHQCELIVTNWPGKCVALSLTHLQRLGQLEGDERYARQSQWESQLTTVEVRHKTR